MKNTERANLSSVSFSVPAIDQFISPSTASFFRSFAVTLPHSGKRRKQNRQYVRGRVISDTVVVAAADEGKWREIKGWSGAEEVAPECYPTIQEVLYKQREGKEIPERRKKWRT